MALKRMFSAEVVNTDKFKTMPPTAQNLYFHLGMCADDDGLVGNAVITMRSIDSKAKDLTVLIDNGYIHKFKSGIVVIIDWKVNNTIQKDRYKETLHTEEKAQLQTASNKRYILEAECIQHGNTSETQYRLDKISIDKDSIGDGSLKADKPPRTRFIPPTIDEVKAYCIERGNTVDAERFIDYYTANGWQIGKNKMRDWKAAVRTWERNGIADTKPKSGGMSANIREEDYKTNISYYIEN